MDTIRNVVGQRESEKALQLGRLYSGEEALKVGLIDELVPETSVLDHAKQELLKWTQIPSMSNICSVVVIQLLQSHFAVYKLLECIEFCLQSVY